MAILNYAQEVYRSDSDQILMPRQKYNFSLVVYRHDRQPVVFHQISSVSIPGYTFDVEILNQYNKKRVVQKRIDYGTSTVSFYDTFNNDWDSLMRDYIKHYFNGKEGIESRTTLEGSSVIDPNFITDLGYTLTDSRYFFPQISIVQNGYRNQYRETILINPIITGIQGDQLNYSSSDPVQWTVDFQPESIQIRDVNKQFDDAI